MVETVSEGAFVGFIMGALVCCILYGISIIVDSYKR
ncbi:hypothetical protein Thu_251 [Bacillus phage Thurquoise]|nr:hypothetical protein Thu_7 [Bacillus phage Thurquoise]UXQ89094.1 hypothetical protein Thu_251 [Bacillus phage Thurquoise]